MNQMRRRLAVVALSTGLLAGCATVPVTGRQQLSLVSSGEMQKMAAQEYRSFLAENPRFNGPLFHPRHRVGSTTADLVYEVGEVHGKGRLERGAATLSRWATAFRSGTI